ILHLPGQSHVNWKKRPKIFYTLEYDNGTESDSLRFTRVPKLPELNIARMGLGEKARERRDDIVGIVVIACKGFEKIHAPYERDDIEEFHGDYSPEEIVERMAQMLLKVRWFRKGMRGKQTNTQEEKEKIYEETWETGFFLLKALGEENICMWRFRLPQLLQSRYITWVMTQRAGEHSMNLTDLCRITRRYGSPGEVNWKEHVPGSKIGEDETFTGITRYRRGIALDQPGPYNVWGRESSDEND
ncbi:hypothetical protein DM02DRAFT_636821, partial [Periconia macrospinosa]